LDDKKDNIDPQKSDKIKKERNRLRRQFSSIRPNKKRVVEGLIDRAAFLRVSLEELELDLNTNGYTEWFKQGNQDPYLRRRPQADLHISFTSNYQKAIKALTDLLPKNDLPEKENTDGFDEFSISRDDI